jgi:hypothetical protein
MAVNIQPFNPFTGTVALTVGTSTANVVLPSSTLDSLPPLMSVRIVNVGTNPTYVAFGGSGVTAVIPTSGGGVGAGLMILPNTERVFLISSGPAASDPAYSPTSAVYIACIAASTGNTIYVTVGESI